MDKKLTFKVHRAGDKELVNPRWRKVEVENTDCPQCYETMIVVIGNKGILYGYCPKCKEYFIGE